MLEEIKRSLTMLEIACFYGFKPNRGNYIPCPLHGEKTASMRLYSDNFYCYGCGVGGDMIKFVQLYFNISFPQALIRINSDFRLGLTDKKPIYSKPVQRKATPEELYEIEYNKKWGEYHKLLFARDKLKPKSMSDTLNPLFIKSLQQLEHLQYYLDSNPIPKRR